MRQLRCDFSQSMGMHIPVLKGVHFTVSSWELHRCTCMDLSVKHSTIDFERVHFVSRRGQNNFCQCLFSG